MRTLPQLAGLLVAVCCATDAIGHGNPIQVNVSDGRLTVARGLSLSEGFARLASDPHEDAAFDFAPNQKLRSSYPGYDLEGLSADATLQFEIIARPDFSSAGRPLRWLWYWSSASQSVADVPNNATFNAVPLFGMGAVQATQSSLIAGPALTMANPVGPFLGADQHLLLYELQNYAPAGTGAYGIFARLASPGLQPSEPFLLLFRYGAVPEDFEAAALAINASATGLAGDYNLDGIVDAIDYTVWRNNLGDLTEDDIHHNGDGQQGVDAVDHLWWKQHYGNTSPGTGGVAFLVPESEIWLLALSAGILQLLSTRVRPTEIVSKLPDHQKPGKYAAGPAYVLGTTFVEGFNIESSELDPNSVDTLAESFGSPHLGGCFFLFCDGGVRFVRDNSDPGVMNTLATRDGRPHSGEERIVHSSPF